MQADGVALKEWTQLLVDRERQRVDDLEKRIDVQLDASNTAVNTAASALTIRLEHSNGLIEQMRQQSMDFSRKSELRALELRVASLEQLRSSLEGRREGSAPIYEIGFLIVGAIVAFIATRLTRRSTNGGNN